MSAYWITRCHILDPDIYNKYLELAGPAIIKYGGKFLVRGGNQIEKEGDGYERTVLVQFESLDQAQRCYDSDEYSDCLLYTSPSPRDMRRSRMPSSA